MPTIVWPAAPRRSAMARPMPRLTPVTSVTGPATSDRRDRRRRRADRTGQAQRRRGQEEAVAPVLAQPGRQRRELPELAEIDAELEQAVLVQRQHRMAAGARRRRHGLDAVV